EHRNAITSGALHPQLNPTLAPLLLAASKPHPAAFLQADQQVALQALQPARELQRLAPFRAVEGVEVPVARQRLRLIAQSLYQPADECVHASTIPSPTRGASRYPLANLTTDVGPPCGELWQLIDPPCAWRICCETAKPSPVPPSLVEKNGSKMRSRTSLVIPRPLSQKATSASPLTMRDSTISSPPPGIASRLLRRRFRKTCRSCPSSASARGAVGSSRRMTFTLDLSNSSRENSRTLPT